MGAPVSGIPVEQFMQQPQAADPLLVALFRRRPVWTASALCASCPRHLHRLFNSQHLSKVAYVIKDGPFVQCWVRFGYDPRAATSSRFFQVTVLRLPDSQVRPSTKRYVALRSGFGARRPEAGSDWSESGSGGGTGSGSVSGAAAAALGPEDAAMSLTLERSATGGATATVEGQGSGRVVTPSARPHAHLPSIFPTVCDPVASLGSAPACLDPSCSPSSPSLPFASRACVPPAPVGAQAPCAWSAPAHVNAHLGPAVRHRASAAGTVLAWA